MGGWRRLRLETKECRGRHSTSSVEWKERGSDVGVGEDGGTVHDQCRRGKR